MDINAVAKLKLLTAIARRFSNSDEKIDMPDEEIANISGLKPYQVESYIDDIARSGAIHQEAYDDEAGGFHYISAARGLAAAVETPF